MTDGTGPRAGTLLLVGVASYDDPDLDDLEATRRQVQLVRAAFEGTGFAARDPLLGRVTRADADSFFGGVDEVDDTVVVYWAGHGVQRGHEGWLLTSESRASAPSAATALAATDLARHLARLPARQVLLILDCCGAGRIGSTVGLAVAGGPDEPWQGDDRPPEVTVVAASHGVEPAAGLAVAEALARAVPGGYARRPWPASQRFVTPVMLTDAVNTWLDQSNAGDAQRAVCLGAGGSAGMLPNPRWGLADEDDAGDDGLVERRTELLARMRAWHGGAGGLLVLTGSEGTGKTWLLRQFDDLLRAVGDQPPVVLHTAAAAAQDVTGQLALRLGLDPARPAGVDAVLEAAARRPVTLLLDGLDRLDPPARRELVAVLLLPLAAVPSARVVVASGGMGPLLRAGDPLAVLAAGASLHLDLDDEQAQAVVARSVRRRLADSPASPYRDRPELTRAVAAAVAEAGEGVLAFASWMGRQLVVHPRALAPGEEELAALLRRGTDVLVDGYLKRFGDARAEAEAVLRPLAWTEGEGLTPGETWLRLVEALRADPATGPVLTLEALCDVVARCSPLLAADPGGRPGLRLRRAFVADHLRRTTPVDGSLAERRVLAALRPRPGMWASADPYVLRHLAAHAERTGALAQVLDDGDALVHLEPATTLPRVHRLPLGDRGWGADLYLRAGTTLLGRQAGGRRLLLDVLRRQASEPRARGDVFAGPPAFPLLWATGRQKGRCEVLRNGPQVLDAVTTVPDVTGEWLVVVGAFHRRGGEPAEHLLELRTMSGELRRVLRTGVKHQVQALARVDLQGESLLVALGDDDVLRAWGPVDAEPRWTAASRQPVLRLAVVRSARGPLLATTSSTSGVELWHPHDGTWLGELQPPAGSAADVTGLTVAGVNVLCTTTTTGHLFFWNVDTGASLGGFEPEEPWTTVLGVRSEGQPVFVGTRQDGRLECRDGRNGLRLELSPRQVLEGWSETALVLRDGTDDACLAVDDDDQVLVWHARTLHHRATLAGHAGGIVGLAAVPDPVVGERLVTAGRDGTVRSWVIPTAARFSVAAGDPADEHDYWRLFAGRLDGRAVVVAAASSEVVVLDAGTGERLHVQDEPIATTADGFSYSPKTSAVLPAGDDLLALSGRRGPVQEVWSLRDRTWYAVRLPGVRGQEGEVSAVVHPGEQALLAVARADAPVMLVDLRGAQVGTLDDSAGCRALGAVHGNGRLVLLERGNQLLCWEVPTGRVRHRLGPLPKGARALAAVAVDGTVGALLSTADRATLLTPEGAYELDGDYRCATGVQVGERWVLAAGSGEDVVVLDPLRGTELARLPVVGWVHDVVSPLPGVLCVLGANRLVTVRLEPAALAPRT